MKIHIKDTTYVESDGQQFLIKKYGNSYEDKDGNLKESYQVLGYYGTLEQLINGVVRKELLESKATSFNSLRDELQELRKYIGELLSDKTNL